jgi:hypothetical protein
VPHRTSVAVVSVAFALASLFRTGEAAAATASGDRLMPLRAETPFALDPMLADPRWAQATFVTGFTDLGTRVPSRSKTEAAVFYDDANFYVAFRVEQRVALTATQRTNNLGFGAVSTVRIVIASSFSREASIVGRDILWKVRVG